MNAQQLGTILADVAAGRLTPDAAIERLRHLPFEDLAFARVDHHRALRQGQPEVVFCEGKTPEQVVAICERLAEMLSKQPAPRPEVASALLAVGEALLRAGQSERANRWLQMVAARFPGSPQSDRARTLLPRN